MHTKSNAKSDLARSFDKQTVEKSYVGAICPYIQSNRPFSYAPRLSTIYAGTESAETFVPQLEKANKTAIPNSLICSIQAIVPS